MSRVEGHGGAARRDDGSGHGAQQVNLATKLVLVECAAGTPAQLNQSMRTHAHVESHIQRLKDSGLSAFPFSKFEANASWLMCVALAGDLVRQLRLLCPSGAWQHARPKALRRGIFLAPGRLVYRARSRIVRQLEGWPAAGQILHAYEAIALLS